MLPWERATKGSSGALRRCSQAICMEGRTKNAVTGMNLPLPWRQSRTLNYLFICLFIYLFLFSPNPGYSPPPPFFFSFQLRKLEKSRDFKRVVWMKVAWPRNMYKTTLLFCCSHLLLPPCLLLWLQVWSLNAVVCMSVLGGSTQVENNASEVASQWAHVI